MENHALNGVLYNDTRPYQVPLSQSRGGLGLRPPSIFEPAAKISSFVGRSQMMARFFPFHYNFNSNLINLQSKDKNSTNSDNNQNNLAESIVNQLTQIDSQQKQNSQFENKIEKHLVDISLQNNHNLATNNINTLLAQNLVYHKITAKYFDSCEQVSVSYNI